jgi:hypothetical protein
VAEGGLLTLVAPAARSVAPQVTALPSVAAYHDLRWLFTDSKSWPWFAGLVVALLMVRSALDVALLWLAWPRGLAPPSLRRSFASCAVLTALAWVLLLPSATLAFGVAVLPFSWPFLAAFPIMLGIVTALSHGGAFPAWWRRLPPVRAVGALIGSFVALTAAGAVIAHLPAGAALPVMAAAGLVNARAWYGIAGLAARRQPRAYVSVPARLVFGLPFAPLSALLVIALVVGLTRLMLTGAIMLPLSATTGPVSPVSSASSASETAPATKPAPVAVLVVGGWGSSCCDADAGLRAELPGVWVRQFSYLGLRGNGTPLPSGPDADDLSLPVLGDRLAGQVGVLHRLSGEPVDIVAESEGTLAVYAMLDRHPGLPIGAIVLLSPIVEPGQVSYPPGRDGASVSEEALDELNSLVGAMSPYGPSGAADLLNSVSEFGARYFADVATGAVAARGADGKRIRLLSVIPLADAVTLPVCSLPAGVLVVPALHGGLLRDPTVLLMVATFLSGRQVSDASDAQFRSDAELITSAATAWRMPETTAACPG